MATGKTIPLTRRIFVGKIMSLLLKMLSRLVIAFLPRTKWLYLGGSKITVDFTFTFHFHALEKEMATHSSVLAWRIPGTEEPGGLPSMGSHRVGHDWSNLAAAAAAHASKVMLKILQARLQQSVNREIPDVQAGFRKGKGTRDQIANIHWIMEKAREFQKNIYFCFID